LSDASFLLENIDAKNGKTKTGLKREAFGEIYFQLDSSCIVTKIEE
jgi:hypothetical protein